MYVKFHFPPEGINFLILLGASLNFYFQFKITFETEVPRSYHTPFLVSQFDAFSYKMNVFQGGQKITKHAKQVTLCLSDEFLFVIVIIKV